MDTTGDNPDHLVPEPEIGHLQDLEISQNDEFDFEIGGDDAFDLAGDAGIEQPDLMGQADAVETQETHDDQSYMYQSEDHDVQGSATDIYNDTGADSQYGHGVIDMANFGLDSLAETGDPIQDPDSYGQEDPDVAGQEEMLQSNEYGSHEEVYYDETIAESEYQDESAQSALLRDFDLTNTATSVEYVCEEDSLQERIHDADQNEAEAYSHAPPESQSAQYEARDTVDVDHTNFTALATDRDSEPVDNASNPKLAENEASDEALGVSLDQSNWNEDEDENENEAEDENENEAEDEDEDHVNAGPVVTVSYAGQEYSMFAQSPEDNPDTYFLDEVEYVHQPLSQFLATLRAVISSDIQASQELFMKFDGLNLEFGESTTKEFLAHTSLAAIIEVNDKLSQNDGGSQHAELYIILSLQSNPLHRFNELAKYAEEGRGLSYIEQYDEPSADDTVSGDEEQYQGSPHELPGELDEAADEMIDSQKAQSYTDSFQVDDGQQSGDGITITTVNAEVEAAEKGEIASIQNGNLLDVVNVSGEEATETGDATEVQTEMPIDNSEVGYDGTDGETSISLRGYGCLAPKFCICENCYEFDVDFGVKAVESTATTPSSTASRNSNAFTDAEWDVIMRDTVTPQQDNTVTDKQPEDNIANMATDEDYLYLGDDDGTHLQSTGQVTINSNAAGQLDTQRQSTPDSCATGTLNGEETGHGDEAAVYQPTTADSSQAPDETTKTDGSPDEGDEIDWNHDEDDQVGDALQNPAGLSPSSLSVKRGRQEDEASNGLGDDAAAKRRRI